jgi:hypothetical protein
MVEIPALSAPLAWKTGKFKHKLLQDSRWKGLTPLFSDEVTVQLKDFDRAPAVVMPWAASVRDTIYWESVASDFKKLFSPLTEVSKMIGRGLTTIVRKPYDLVIARCVEVERARDLCDRYRREASEVVDGYGDSHVESTYDPRMFLQLAPDIICLCTQHVEPPKDKEELVIKSVALSHLPLIGVEGVQQFVGNNYVIRKGKRTFYCHTLLSILKARLGAMPKTDLNMRVVRRNAFKECESHGLRPRDRAVAVEFVTQMYFKYSAIEREVGFMSMAYDNPEPKGWFKRAYHDFRLFFGFGKPLDPLLE